MIQANDYRGREQTYVKHVFLNHYLERVAWVTLANNRGWQEFVYIDGFAGPWRVSSEDSRDTSVSIALRKHRGQEGFKCEWSNRENAGHFRGAAPKCVQAAFGATGRLSGGRSSST